MEAFYFKYKPKYLNGEAKEYCYYKIQKDGTVTTLSVYKKTLAAPKSITIPAGSEPIEEQEFETIKKSLGF